LVRLSDTDPAAATHRLRTLLGDNLNFVAERAGTSGPKAVKLFTLDSVLDVT
jgi:hypothetical protein